MKVYRGCRSDVNGTCTVTVGNGGKSMVLPLYTEVRNHSPAGFEWGYTGSGPAQLALALLLNATGSKWVALRLYQTYKFGAVAGLNRERWELRQEAILAWVFEELRKELMLQDAGLDLEEDGYEVPRTD